MTGYRLVLSQYGYLPDQQKRAYLVESGANGYDPGSGPILPNIPDHFSVLAVETRLIDERAGVTGCPSVIDAQVNRLTEPDSLGVIAHLDFSSLRQVGYYQLEVGGHRSHPFAVRADLYARTAYNAFLYSNRQRCGCSVPGWHCACHRDDAVLPDGTHEDLTGGWHDAGDLRKWVDHTLWQAIGILWLARYGSVTWCRYPHHESGFTDDLLDELHWGNRYFLAVQDTRTGAVRRAVGGPEEENFWADCVLSADDRRLNPTADHHVQFKFSWVERLIAACFRAVDPAYAERCETASRAAWNAGLQIGPPEDAGTLTLSLAVLAAPDPQEHRHLLDALLNRQLTAGSWRGAFLDSHRDAPQHRLFTDWWQHAFLGWALFESAARLKHGSAGEQHDANRALAGAQEYLGDYVKRLAGLSSFGCPPLVVTDEPETWDRYRFAGELAYYRFFLPCRSLRTEEPAFRGYGQGSNTALLGYAALLGRAARVFDQDEFREMALRQLEWVHGANPLGICMVTGRSAHGFYPHSRYIGPIPDGVANGITGNADDAPHFGSGPYDLEWQTREYWSPQQAQYLMALVELGELDRAPDIGVRHLTKRSFLPGS